MKALLPLFFCFLLFFLTVNVKANISYGDILRRKMIEYINYFEPYIFENATYREPTEIDYSGNYGVDHIMAVSNFDFMLLNYASENETVLEWVKQRMNQYVSNPIFNKTYGGFTFPYLFCWAKYNNSDLECDASPKLTMYAGILAVRLYELTGNITYKLFADKIADATRNHFTFLENATDLGYSCAYYFMPYPNATLIGTNRQVSIAWFYSEYARLNSSFADYVPLIIHWTWRGQLDNGGLPYSIGQTWESTAYTAYQLYFALKAYANVPDKFNPDLKMKIQKTINRVLEYPSCNGYLCNIIYSACLLEAYRSGFITSISDTYKNKVKTFLMDSLSSLTYDPDGIHLQGVNYGRRWPTYFLTALYSEHPIYFLDEPSIEAVNNNETVSETIKQFTIAMVIIFLALACINLLGRNL